MAKKPAETPVIETPKFSAEGGKGKKMCPACNMFVGARVTGKCPNPDCKHEFKQAEPKEKKPANSFHQQELDFGETVELLGKVKGYAKDYGGVKKMLEEVEAIEEISMQCGGIAGLKKALLALESL